MTKWVPVFIGFILTLLVKSFFGHYEFFGLILVGFIVGYVAKSGIFGGMWNAALSGALGTIIAAILFIIIATFGGSLLGIFGGLTGFTISGLSSLIVVLDNLIYYAIVMGITGAIGGAVASKK